MCVNYVEYSKLPPIFWADDFDNCMLLGEEGLYCTIDFKLLPIDRGNVSIQWKNIQELMKNPKRYQHDLLRHGICIPTTCPSVTRNVEMISKFKDKLTKCYNKKFVSDGLYGEITHMHCQNNIKLFFDVYDISMM
ncbi:uncharacterized protein LOC123307001 [Coccinella septempunctata]|uniref:uncharacterized protein LOC123307001 n=1 Tax=Coccinella septempunctata TaxID=41139 RepID=UPI001D066350|nr:uncharacterized protein LOC123307001 [Coccinella septempunctata]